MDPQATDSLLLTACRPGRAERTSLLLLCPEDMKTPCSLYSWETLDSESHCCGHNLDPVHQRLMHMIEPDRTVCRCSRVTDCDEFKSPFFVCLTSFCSFCLWNRTFPLVFIKELLNMFITLSSTSSLLRCETQMSCSVFCSMTVLKSLYIFENTSLSTHAWKLCYWNGSASTSVQLFLQLL